MARRRDGPVDNSAGRGVAAHRVNCNPKHARCLVPAADSWWWLFFFDRTSLPAPVVPAVRAHAVRRFGLVTVRALAEANGPQGVVRAALGGSCFGVSSFWIRHRLRTLSWSLANPSEPRAADLPSYAGTGRCRD